MSICYNRWSYGLKSDKGLLVSHSVVSNSLWPHGLWPTKLLCPWDSPGKNTGVDCHSFKFLQICFTIIFPLSIYLSIFDGEERRKIVSIRNFLKEKY